MYYSYCVSIYKQRHRIVQVNATSFNDAFILLNYKLLKISFSLSHGRWKKRELIVCNCLILINMHTYSMDLEGPFSRKQSLVWKDLKISFYRFLLVFALRNYVHISFAFSTIFHTPGIYIITISRIARTRIYLSLLCFFCLLLMRKKLPVIFAEKEHASRSFRWQIFSTLEKDLSTARNAFRAN